MNQRARAELLDCIRAVAIFLVVVFHVVIEFPRDSLGPIGEWFYRYGFLGVDIFFPLSGYLITLYLIRNNDGPAVKVFFLRRIFRIVPLYMVAAVLYFIAAEILNEEPGVERAWITVLFLTGWFILFEGRTAVPFTITWSLSVEEFAYILVGLTFLFVKRRPVLVLTGIALFSVALRAWLLAQGYAFNMVYYFPPARLDSIILGSLTAIALTKGYRTQLTWALPLALLVTVVASHTSLMAFRMLLFPGVAVGVCILITLFEGYAKGFTSTPTRLMGQFGFYAYFIYLFHYFAIFGVEMVFGVVGIEAGPTLLSIATLITITIAAVLSWKLFEYPLIQYGRSLEAPRTPSATETQRQAAE